MGTKINVFCLVGMTDEIYSKFNASDFSTDAYFLQWRMTPDEESEWFWKSFMETHPGKKEAVLSAIRIINSVQFNDDRLSENEMLTEWVRIHHFIKKSATRKRRLVYSLSIASSLALLLTLSWLFFAEKADEKRLADQPATKEIRLTLPDQRSVAFGENADIVYDRKGNVTVNTSKNKERFAQKITKGDLPLNKLTVPPGKISSLTLADGSKIWINSGTTLEFPSVFEDDGREIKVNGEIYIEVAHQEKTPFLVHTAAFSVSVLGTEFNVSAYREDAVQRVTLVQGSVEVNMPSGARLRLQPDEMFSLSETGFHSEKVDVFDYISWKDGIFRFTGEPLGNILVRLSRHYDVPIACEDDAKNLLVTGKLALFDDLTVVLNNIGVIIPVTYRLENNNIIISKK